MELDDATHLLENSLGQQGPLHDTDSSAELLKELTFLPLAITQAAAYMNRNGVSIAEYLGLWRDAEQSVVSLMTREFRDPTRYSATQSAVATAWFVSFESIRVSDAIAADLLSFISCVEPKSIPRSMLPELGPTEQMVNAIGTLCSYTLLTRRKDDMFDTHSLVHLASRIWVDRQGLAVGMTKTVMQHLAAIFPSSEHTSRPKWQAHLPHAFRVLREGAGLDLQQRSGREIHGNRLEKVCRWRESHLPEDDNSLLASQHALARASRADGQIRRAVELLEHVVAVRERVLERNHPDLLSSQHVLAIATRANGSVSKAIELLERVVSARNKTLSKNDPDRLAAQHTLARAYEADGRIKESTELLEEVQAITQTD
ncbi:Putative Kinesin light chain [Tolypocladium paradoxum]|uniref:Kinesin light chain n=1 Tax=Tolypocladium paradoxum TaxID=94208 RepID=A0A2S4KTN4_9HYPO|nr:Putative Kinesin light chain [Tolypocladium paradoxum]